MNVGGNSGAVDARLGGVRRVVHPDGEHLVRAGHRRLQRRQLEWRLGALYPVGERPHVAPPLVEQLGVGGQRPARRRGDVDDPVVDDQYGPSIGVGDSHVSSSTGAARCSPGSIGL